MHSFHRHEVLCDDRYMIKVTVGSSRAMPGHPSQHPGMGESPDRLSCCLLIRFKAVCVVVHWELGVARRQTMTECIVDSVRLLMF